MSFNKPEVPIEVLKNDVTQWNTWKQDNSLVVVRFKGVNLSYLDLNNANLRKADLTWANFSNTNLCGANLNNANLRKADLTWANLKDTKISDSTEINEKWRLVCYIVTHGSQKADLIKADLTRSNFRKADLTYTD